MAAPRQVSLGEAGQLANDKVAIAHVAVDLPASYQDNPEQAADSFLALSHTVSAGELVVRPSVAGAPYRRTSS